MNKNILWIIAVAVIIIGGGMFVTNQQSKKAQETKMAQEKAAMKEKQDKDAIMKKDAAMEKKEGDAMVADKNNTSRYVEYSKVALDQVADKRRVLYFYASWCPICRPADANFKENTSKIPKDMVVVRVNYNDPDTDQEEKDLAKKYGITYQHTFVQIDAQGKQVIKWNGGQIEELLANIK